MSVRLMAAVFELDLSPATKIVLLAMADHARDDGTGCYPSIATLAKKTSMSRRGVQTVMRDLEAAHFIVTTKKGGGRTLTTEYQITPEKGERDALFAKTKQRTARHKTAHHTAENSAPGAPEPSLTVLNRQAAAKPSSKPKPKPESIWGCLGIKPCGSQDFQKFIEGCWPFRNGERPSVVIGRALDAWEDTEGSKPARCGRLFRALADLRKREASPAAHALKLPSYDQMVPAR